MWHNTSFQVEVVNANWTKFFEPLKTSAPKEAQPYCCYFRTIIFYKDRRTLEKFDEVESQWDLLGRRWTEKEIGWSALAPFVCHHGEYFELCSNQVAWQNDASSINKGWFVIWSARRVLKESDQRLLTWLSEVCSNV